MFMFAFISFGSVFCSVFLAVGTVWAVKQSIRSRVCCRKLGRVESGSQANQPVTPPPSTRSPSLSTSSSGEPMAGAEALVSGSSTPSRLGLGPSGLNHAFTPSPGPAPTPPPLPELQHFTFAVQQQQPRPLPDRPPEYSNACICPDNSNNESPYDDPYDMYENYMFFPMCQTCYSASEIGQRRMAAAAPNRLDTAHKAVAGDKAVRALIEPEPLQTTFWVEGSYTSSPRELVPASPPPRVPSESEGTVEESLEDDASDYTTTAASARQLRQQQQLSANQLAEIAELAGDTNPAYIPSPAGVWQHRVDASSHPQTPLASPSDTASLHSHFRFLHSPGGCGHSAAATVWVTLPCDPAARAFWPHGAASPGHPRVLSTEGSVLLASGAHTLDDMDGSTAV